MWGVGSTKDTHVVMADRSYNERNGSTFNAEKNAGNINKHGISLDRAKDFAFGTAFFEVDDSQTAADESLRQSFVKKK